MKRAVICLAVAGFSLCGAGTPPAFAESAVEFKQLSPDAQVQALIDSGLRYLKSQQTEAGTWGDEKTPPAITALALKAFVQEPSLTADTDFVKKGYDALLKNQLDDGGIYRNLLASYNTSICVSSLSAVEDDRFKPQIDKAVAYLKKLQWTPDTRPEYVNDQEKFKDQQVVKDDKDPFFGGWGYGGNRAVSGHGRPDMSNAGMVLQALHDARVDASDPSMQRAILFLSRCQNASETNDQAWAGNDGGFVYGPAVDKKGESFAGEYTGPDGKRMLRSYGSMTYVGLKSFIYAGLTKDDPRVKAAFDWITKNWSLDENPGLKLNNADAAKNGLYYYYQTLAKALHAYGQPTITDAEGETVDWRLALVAKLKELQKEDGSWAGEKRWMEDNPVLVTSYVVLALQEVREDLKARPAK
ncbi:MAG: terpene cyclase/mutase family protein [Tepidisphaeraceae bacterium]